MGVLGLTTYVEKHCRYVVEPCFIPELADKYRLKSGKKPLLLIDVGQSFIKLMYEKAIEQPLVGGGQLKEGIIPFLKILGELIQHDIEVILIFTGSAPDERIVRNRNKDVLIMDKVNIHFNDLDNGQGTREPILTPKFVQHYLKNQLTARKIRFITPEAKKENTVIMEYLFDHECFGILSNDSDFMLASDIPYFFHAETVTSSLHANMYRQEEIARALGLPHWQLPFFATISGNDVITRFQLRSFHESLMHDREVRRFYDRDFIPARCLFPYITDWLKNFFRNQDDCEDLPEILAKAVELDDLAEEFRKSVYSYLPIENKAKESPISCSWDMIVKQAGVRLQQGTLDPMPHCVITRGKHFDTALIELYNDFKFPCSAVMLEPLVLRLYGVLLKERPSEKEKPEVKQCIVKGPGTFDDFTSVMPEYPDNHPGLLTLWSDECDVNVKWRMLCWIVCPHLNYQHILDVPKKLRVPTLALYYIKNVMGDLLRDHQLDSLLVQAVLLTKIELRDILETGCQTPTTLAVHIGSVYMNVAYHIYAASGVCGNPTALFQHPTYVYFDARLFYNAYQGLEKGKTTVQELLDKFPDTRSVFDQVKLFVKGVVPRVNEPKISPEEIADKMKLLGDSMSALKF